MALGRQKIQCPWCGRIVGWSKRDNLEPHINQAGKPCVGQGQPKHQVLENKRQRDAARIRRQAALGWKDTDSE